MGHLNPFFERAGFVRVGVFGRKGTSREAHSAIYGGSRGNQRLLSQESHEKSRYASPIYYVFDNRKREGSPEKSPQPKVRNPSRKTPPQKDLLPTDTTEMAPCVLPFAPNQEASRLIEGPLREEFLSWMIKGASPTVACEELGLSMSQFWETCEADDQFLAALERAYETLSLSVVSALYRSAIKGSVPAQTFWIRQHPPGLWASTAEGDAGTQISGLSDEELATACRKAGIEVPGTASAGSESADGEASSA